MRAIFIAVGSEMLDLERADTNSLYVARKLMEKGILLNMKVVVGDDMENLRWIIKQSCKRAQLVIISGGLGPTEDDITREATANALKKELVFKEELVDAIRERFRIRGIDMPDINTRQAFVIADAEVLPNPRGTAPGLYLEHDNCQLVLLPGPPGEMKPIFDQVMAEKIAPLANFFIYTKSFRFAGISESEADSMLAEIYAKYKNPRTTVLSTPGIIEVHLLGRSRKTIAEAQKLTDELAGKIRERMGEYLFSEENISLEQYIVNLLQQKGLTLAVAESCTGGALGNRITNVSGSSKVFLGGVIAYANEVKIAQLKVKKSTIDKNGAVSREVAREMAQGVRKLTGADIGVAITGIAGPGGEPTAKPVGLVFMHLSSKDEEKGTHQIFPGERRIVKVRTVNHSLNLIRRFLLSRMHEGE